MVIIHILTFSSTEKYKIKIIAHIWTVYILNTFTSRKSLSGVSGLKTQRLDQK